MYTRLSSVRGFVVEVERDKERKEKSGGKEVEEGWRGRKPHRPTAAPHSRVRILHNSERVALSMFSDFCDLQPCRKPQ